MNPARLLYRTHQFWKALAVRPQEMDLEQASKWLSASQRDLFDRMQPAEQAHSLRMLRLLAAQGENHPDLMAAALLHDVGKIHFPLQVWQRIWIVLAHATRPAWAKNKGRQSVQPGQHWPSWQKALMVAEQHAGWGAELAVQSGSSPRLVELIRRHHEQPLDRAHGLEDVLLQKLQAVDNES